MGAYRELTISIVTVFILFISYQKLNASVCFSTEIAEQKVYNSFKKSNPPHDYGDRSKLSAFILCSMLGFTGAHHFYMKHYFSGALQLSFFLLSSVLSVFGIAIFFSWLFILALWAWVAADLLLIIFDGLRLRKGKKLIPFEQSI
jgi:TM2 domain-containing membrane protein YozV